MVPGIIMMVLVLIPAVMTALGVVREKELGSITNFYVTPTTGLEFLLGKQLPYVGSRACSTSPACWRWRFSCSRCRSKAALLALTLGATLYVIATTAFGLLISSFVKTQIAAIFATAILTTLPAIQFSGHAAAGLFHVARRAGDRPCRSPAPTSSTSASAPSPRRWASAGGAEISWRWASSSW